MADPTPPEESRPNILIGARDRDDLLHPNGALTHGGRAYRRELLARIMGTLARQRGGFTRTDAEAGVLAANRIIEALVADDTRFG